MFKLNSKFLLVVGVYLIQVNYAYSNQVTWRCENSYNNTQKCMIENYNNDLNEWNPTDDSIIYLGFINSTLSYIPTKIFTELRNLETLNLSKSHIKQIENLSLESRVAYLNLSCNEIKEISEHGFYGVTNLMDLDLSYNQIEKIHPMAFNKLPKLRTINLSYNYITTTSTLTFGMSCRYLNLNNNKLHFLSIDSGLIELQANNNNLENKNLSLFYADNINLTSLSLKNNSFSNFNEFNNLINLNYLDLSDNPLRYIYNGDDVIPNLKTLILKSTDFEQFELFSHLPNLRTLDISSNNLMSVNWNMMSRLDNLKFLKLNNNNLNAITLKEWDYLMPNLDEIDISENNWNCTELIKTLTKLKELRIKIIIDESNFIKSITTNVHGIRCTNNTEINKLLPPPEYIPEINRTLNIINTKLFKIALNQNETNLVNEQISNLLSNIQSTMDKKMIGLNKSVYIQIGLSSLLLVIVLVYVGIKGFKFLKGDNKTYNSVSVDSQ